MYYINKKLLIITSLFFLLSINIFAIVEGTYPSNDNLQRYSVFGSVATTGNTMMDTTPPGNVNDILLTESSGDLRNIPYDAEIVAAHIFWSGSLGPTVYVPDNSINLTTKDNDFHIIEADSCKVVTSMEGFYYCSANVTPEIALQSVTDFNGRYTVSGLKGDVGNCQLNPYLCQAKYAAWSMVVVYKSKSAKVKREILLYDSFLHLDEQEDSIGITQFNINNLTVNSPARGEFTYFGLEGDKFLGVPPQNAPENDFPCDTCYDFIQLNNVKLHDDLNYPNNIWNSSLATAVDIDTFNIGDDGLNILQSGENKTITVKMGSGDGIIPNEHPEAGGGESVFLGYVLLALDTISPNFRTSNTSLVVDRNQASQGDELTYILTVTNDGSKVANNVMILNSIPPETDYVMGSTYVDGVLTNDNINSMQGLNIGTIDYRNINKKIITFRVKVKNSVLNGSYVYNKSKIISDETIDDPSITNIVSTLINAPDLQTPILTVRDENAGDYLPGEWVEYSVEIKNNGNNPISNIIYKNQLPSDFTTISITSFPSGAVNNSDLANKMVQIDSIEVPSRSTITIKYRAKIKTITEYINSGISEDQIDNRLISSQGSISTAASAQLILTDNNNGGNEHDPTTFRIKKAVNANFSESTMIVENVNGGTVYRPGDRVKYTIMVKNSATSDVSAINVLNNINETYFEEISVTNGFYDGDNLTWIIDTLAPQEQRSLTFTAKIKKPQVNGLIISNQASVYIAGRTDLTDDPSTTQIDDPTKFTITASSSNFIFSTKEVIDENGGNYFQQGDYVTYVITIKNTGEAIGQNLIVEDSINDNLTDIQVLNNGEYSNNKIIWNAQNNSELLSVSTPVTLKFRAKIKDSVANGTIISNQALISSSDNTRTYITDDPRTSSVSDSTNFTVNSAAEITESYKLYEDLNGGEIEPNDDIRYTIQVRNTGNLEVTNINIIDNIDINNLEDIRVEDAGVYNNGIITWNGISNISPHNSIELHFIAKIKGSSVHNTKISNQALITSDQIPFAFTDDPNTAEADDPTSFLVTAIPDLTFIKKVSNLNGSNEFKPNDRVKYEINIKNNSNSSTGNITISDLLPPDLENITVSSGGVISSGQAYFYLQPITSDIVVFIEGDIKGNIINQKEICNQALLTDENFGYTINSDDLNTINEKDATCFNVVASVSISDFNKTYTDLNGGEIEPNDEIEYELSFKNDSDIALNNIIISDEISINLKDINLVDGGSFDGSKIVFDSLNTSKLSNIAPNTTVNIKFRAKIKSPLANNTVISNQAELSIDSDFKLLSNDPNTPELNDATEFIVHSKPNIKMTKTVTNLTNSTGAYKPNDQIKYDIIITNTGTDFARNLEIRDAIDITNLTDYSTSNGNFDQTTNEFVYNSLSIPSLANLGINQPIIITIFARINTTVSNNTEILNQAKLNGENTTQILSDNPNTTELNDATKFIVNREDLPVNLKGYKTSDKKIYYPNEIVTYTIEIKNEGGAIVNDVEVNDVLDNNLEFVSASSGGSFSSDKVHWDKLNAPELLQILPNQSVILTIKAKVKSGVLDSTIINNQATYTYRNSNEIFKTDDPVTTTVEDATVITVANYDVSNSTKEVFDSNNDGAFVPNEEVTYKITIKNSSKLSTLNNIIVVDKFPFDKLDILDSTGLIINQNAKTITFNSENFEELQELAPLTELVLVLRAKVKDLTVDGLLISNQAFISYNGGSQNIPTDDPKTTVLDDATNFNLSAKANLSDFTKTVETDTGYFPDKEVRYTLTIKNTGTAKAKNIKIIDAIDDRYLDITDNGGGLLNGNRITFSYENIDELKELKVNESVSFIIKANIKSDIINNTIVSNQAILTSDSIVNTELSDDPTTEAINDTTSFKVLSSASLTSEKIAIDLNSGTLKTNDTIKYQIKVFNKGYKESLGTVLYEQIPEFTKYVANSTKINDVSVNDVNNQAPFINGLDLGDLEIYDGTDNTTKIITFEVIVLETAPDGAKIENQARIENQDGNKCISDDPNTPELNDSTIIYLGDSIIFNKFYKTAIIEDVNNNGKADIDELIEYNINVNVKNISQSITIEDIIPENTNYVSGTLKINNISQTDGVDNDNAFFSNNKVVFYLSPENNEINANISFKVEIKSGVKVVNQASSNFEGKIYLSDNPNTSIENDPTVVYIGDTEESILSINKTVKDLNGGVTLANEELEYSIIVQNTGNKSAQDIEILDNIPQELEFIVNSEEFSDTSAHFVYNPNINDGQIKIYGLNLEPNTKFILTFRAKIKDTVKKGDKITNIASLNDGKEGSSSIVIGASVGSASIYGDLSYFNREKEKIGLKNYKIEITEIKKAEELQVYSVITDENGYFEINNIKPAEYLLKYYNSKGTEFGERKLNYLSSQNDNKLNLVFVPTGVVYEAESNKVISDAKVYLFNKTDVFTNANESNCSDLDLIDNLPINQQGQTLEKNGLYKFTLKDVNYDNVGICISAYPKYTFPSVSKKPNYGAVENENGYVSDDKYYITFTPSDNLNIIENNNIPLDSIKDSIKIIKTVDQKNATANSMITYRIKVDNNSGYSFKDDMGVYIYDILPKNFKLIDKSYKILMKSGNGSETILKNVNVTQNGQNLVFGPLNFLPQEEMNLSYRVAIGSDVEVGKYKNIAYVIDSSNQVISSEASAYVTIKYDFDFDMGALIGRVYCDDNKNSYQDIGEVGLKGVKIYNDEGFMAQTDKYGRYHFTVLKPGNHLIKMDKNTLMSGIKPYEEKRTIRVTKGLLVKVNFPVNCESVNKDKNFLLKDNIVENTNSGKPQEELIVLRGNLNDRMFLGDKEISLKSYKLIQNKKLVTEDEEITYSIKDLDENTLVNYYIYRFNGEVYNYKTKLEDLYRFEQKKGALKIMLPANQYIVFAEIVEKDRVYRTPALVSMSQRIPNSKGEGLIEFKKVKFEFENQLFINGIKINTSKTGKLFKVYHKEDLSNASILLKNNMGQSANFMLQNIKGNNYLFKVDNAQGALAKGGVAKGARSSATTVTDVALLHPLDGEDIGKEAAKRAQDIEPLQKPIQKPIQKKEEGVQLSHIQKPILDRLNKSLGNNDALSSKYIKNFYGVRISLPEENSVIKSDKLYIHGYQPKKYVVFINNIKTAPNEEGYFDFELDVNDKLNKIIVKVIDDKGKEGILTRNVSVAGLNYFLMAFADGTVGYDKARLDDENYVTLPESKLFLQGKAVLYFKGEVKGKILQKYVKDYLKKINATVYVDSSKNSEYEDFYTNLINPERFYPVYGDKSKEVQDVQSKGKVYVKIEADKSSILWGNFNTKIHDSDLVEYDKTLYGLMIDFDKKIKNLDSKATLFYSGDKLTAKTLYNEFQGTGGSLYYLQSTFIKEGTERVKIVVRDRDTGIELYKRYLTLNDDYTINYPTGTLLLKEPIPQFVDNNYLTSGKLDDNSLSGNPVYVTVSYQADTDFNVNNKSTIGFSAKEQYKNVYVTGHVITENRDIGSTASNYKLGGMGIGYNFSKDSFVFTEFAHSSNFDNFSFISDDGGITFKPIGEEYSNVSGNAFSLKGKLAFKDFDIKNEMLSTLVTIFNYQKMDKYFYKVGNREGNDQGGNKISLISKMNIDKNRILNLKYIGVISDYDLSSVSTNKLNKHQVTLRYDQKINSKISFAVEHQSGYISEDREEDLNLGITAFNDSFATNITSAIYRHKIFKDLSISFQQDIIEQYDKRLLDFTTGDRFQSTIGAEYQLTKSIALTALETVRFSGDNSTVAGIKYKIDEKSSMYINQKWMQEERGLSSTLLGAETSLGDGGKLYGEYQLNKDNSIVQSDQDRALVGIGKTYKINEKLSVQGGLEHTYYKVANTETKNRSAISLGLEFKLPKEFVFYTKHEVRYDQFDETKLHYTTTSGAEYFLGDDLTMLGKVNFYITKNLDSSIIEAKMSEMSLGFAFRPTSYDFFNLLGKYSLISQLRPLSLTENVTYKESAHVISLAGIYETPFKLELTEKIVLKYGFASENNTEESLVMTMLWINRLAYHMIETFDIALEYRMRKMFNFDSTMGFLVEGAYKIKKNFYLGVGYNFTSFTDDVFYMDNDDGGGFFVRISGSF